MRTPPCQTFPAEGTPHKPPGPTFPATLFCALAIWLPILTFLALTPAPAHAGWEISYLTEEYYPFNYTEDGDLKGISVNLLRLIWKELGQPDQPIQVMPWARAYDRVCNVSNTVLFSMARTSQRENLFRWAGPIATVRFVLVARKSSRIVLDDLDKAEGYRIGTLRDDITDALLQKHGERNKIEALANMEQNILKLMEGRLDMVAYEERSWKQIAIRHGLSPDDFETVSVLSETPVFYAFNLDIPPNLYWDFQRALDRVKTTPQYQEILDKHLH
jgi:polar amino acid transport system substrate-binding protein